VILANDQGYKTEITLTKNIIDYFYNGNNTNENSSLFSLNIIIKIKLSTNTPT